MPSHQLAYLTIDDLDLFGYSVAGEETVVAMPQLDVCFDIGKAPDQVIPINHVLLTHGHMDHAAGLAYYCSHRKFVGQKPGTILLPPNLIPPVRQILSAWGRLDGNEVPAELVGVAPGDEYPVKPNLFVRVFPTKHTRGSVGFSVVERRKKLRPEYRGLTGPQIVELKKQGVEIDRPVEIPIVSYLGDTRYVDYTSLDYVAKSRIMIAECTFFIDEHIERADAGRHLHIDEFEKLVGPLDNEVVVLTHLTQRTGIAEARRILKNKLPRELYDKILILMDRRRGRKGPHAAPQPSDERTKKA